MQNPCQRQAIITFFCECKTPAGGRQYIYWDPSEQDQIGVFRGEGRREWCEEWVRRE
jgi:hypothetical protein